MVDDVLRYAMIIPYMVNVLTALVLYSQKIRSWAVWHNAC